MEKSSFFNSINGDRKYKAEDLASYFGSFISNGIFPNPGNNLQVIANNDMTVTLKPGKGWINGYFYENTEDLILSIDPADGVLDRIDRVVLRLDYVNREIKAAVKKGTFASSPVAPELQRDVEIYELGLADIYIVHGAISIESNDITDTRLSLELCGITNSLITVDVGIITNQFSEDFDVWFETIKGALDGDVAGNLYNLIEQKVGIDDFNAHKEEIASQDERGHVKFSEVPRLWQKVGEVVVTSNTLQIDIDIYSGLKEVRVIGRNVKGSIASNTPLKISLNLQSNNVSGTYNIQKIVGATVSNLTENNSVSLSNSLFADTEIASFYFTCIATERGAIFSGNFFSSLNLAKFTSLMGEWIAGAAVPVELQKVSIKTDAGGRYIFAGSKFEVWGR